MSKWSGSGSWALHGETLPGSLCAADAACREGFRSGTTWAELLECYWGGVVVVVGGEEWEEAGFRAGRGSLSVGMQAWLKRKAERGVAARHTAPPSGPTVPANTQGTGGYYQAGGASGFAAAAAASGLGSWTGWSPVKSLGAPAPLFSPVPAEEGTA